MVNQFLSDSRWLGRKVSLWFVSCGTSSCTCLQDDEKLFRSTRCWRQWRKSANQLRSSRGMSRSYSLWSKMFWLIRANNLEKSFTQDLILVSGFSVTLSQWWIRWTRAWVINDILTQPNWFGSVINCPSLCSTVISCDQLSLAVIICP